MFLGYYRIAHREEWKVRDGVGRTYFYSIIGETKSEKIIQPKLNFCVDLSQWQQCALAAHLHRNHTAGETRGNYLRPEQTQRHRPSMWMALALHSFLPQD